jgi:hypothetical protein
MQGLAAESLRFLNARGSAAGLRTALDEVEGYPEERLRTQVLVRELTGGGPPEVILTAELALYPGRGGVLVFACNAGMYQLISQHTLLTEGPLDILSVGDMTANGLPEVVYSAVTSAGSGGLGSALVILEWNGSGFSSHLNGDRIEGLSFPYVDDEGVLDVFNLNDAWIVDTDGSGTLELVVVGGTCACRLDEGPQRVRTEYWAWNGQQFALSRWEYRAPEYRFQAVQDGDDATRFGDFEAALAFYQQAIYDVDLKGWAPAEPGAGSFGVPLPEPDPSEWPRLEAYARYRILLLHAVQGYLDAAQIVYDTLQARFPSPRAGHPYAQLAAEFWEEFSVSQDLTAACQRASAYAEAEAAQILEPLGAGFYGVLNRSYQGEDVCPFH